MVYDVTNCHFVLALDEGVYSTLTDEKTKVMDMICWYFVYKAMFIVGKENPIKKMNKAFQVLEGLGNLKSLI